MMYYLSMVGEPPVKTAIRGGHDMLPQWSYSPQPKLWPELLGWHRASVQKILAPSFPPILWDLHGAQKMNEIWGLAPQATPQGSKHHPMRIIRGKLCKENLMEISSPLALRISCGWGLSGLQLLHCEQISQLLCYIIFTDSLNLGWQQISWIQCVYLYMYLCK